jgi:cathepsin L
MLCLLLASISSALIKPHEEKSFISFMRAHSLSYTGDEYQFRLGLYLANARLVREHNAKGTFRVALNHLAVLTESEYKALLGFRRLHALKALNRKGRSADPPASLDYRDQGAVNPIKDQGQCGSCWAFSAIGAQESQWYLTNKVLLSLSEQNLVDCVDTDYGCDGGLPSDAYDYVISKQAGHFELESDYPYKAYDQSCKYDASKAITTIKSYITVKEGDESDLQDKVWNNGPVSVGIDASSWDFQLYSSGVYNEPGCSTTDLDHGVVVIGWGVSGSTPYWLVRNSWGRSWGIQGYIWMSRNKNNQCGIASMAIVPVDV